MTNLKKFIGKSIAARMRVENGKWQFVLETKNDCYVYSKIYHDTNLKDGWYQIQHWKDFKEVCKLTSKWTLNKDSITSDLGAKLDVKFVKNLEAPIYSEKDLTYFRIEKSQIEELKRLNVFTADDPLRYFLMGVYISSEDMVATDGRALIRRDSLFPNLKTPFTFRKNVIELAEKQDYFLEVYKYDEVDYEHTKIFLENDNYIITNICEKLGKFPKYKLVIPECDNDTLYTLNFKNIYKLSKEGLFIKYNEGDKYYPSMYDNAVNMDFHCDLPMVNGEFAMQIRYLQFTYIAMNKKPFVAKCSFKRRHGAYLIKTDDTDIAIMPMLVADINYE